MGKIHLIIADTDGLYLSRLANYFIEKDSGFEVAAFTDPDSLQQYLKNPDAPVELLACSGGFLDSAVLDADIPVKVLFTEEKSQTAQGAFPVFKYQKTENLVNTLRMVYAESTGRTDVMTAGDRRTRLTGIYSPAGGSGKTTIAIALARELSLRGRKVFYFDCERILSTGLLLPQGDGAGLSDIFLSLKTKGAHIGVKLLSARMIEPHTKISYFSMPESCLECNELNASEWRRLFLSLAELSEYDDILIDWDSELSAERIELLHMCDQLLTPFLPDRLGQAKMQAFVREMDIRAELTDLRRKICYIANKVLAAGDLNGFPAAVQAAVPFSPAYADIQTLLYAEKQSDPNFAKLADIIIAQAGGGIDGTG